MGGVRTGARQGPETQCEVLNAKARARQCEVLEAEDPFRMLENMDAQKQTSIQGTLVSALRRSARVTVLTARASARWLLDGPDI